MAQQVASVSQKGQGGGRYYHWPTPDREGVQTFWSVTTIIDGGVPKAALKKWAARESAKFAVGNLSAIMELIHKDADVGPVQTFLEQVFRGNGHGPLTPDEAAATVIAFMPSLVRLMGGSEDGIEAAVDLVKNEIERFKYRTALRGSHVHDAIEAYNLGKPFPGVPAAAAGRYKQFLAFLREHQPRVEMHEATVFNRSDKWAGRLDTIMVLPSVADLFQEQGLWTPSDDAPDGPRLIGDVKNGGVFGEVALQLGTYAHAEFVGLDDGMEYPLPTIHGGFCLQLTDDDYRLIPVRIDDACYQAFLYVREVFRWLEWTSKNVIGRPYPRPKLPTYEDLKKPELVAECKRLKLKATGTAEELRARLVEHLESVPVLAVKHPCPKCGHETVRVTRPESASGRYPKWECSNLVGCNGNKDKNGPWVGWENDPWDAAKKREAKREAKLKEETGMDLQPTLIDAQKGADPSAP